jgi:hypothetical protein
MCRQVGRFEDVNMDSWAVGIEDHCGEAEAGTPARIYQPRLDIALQPVAFEPIELMMLTHWTAAGPVVR